MKVLIIEHAPGRADGLVREARKYKVDFELWKPHLGEHAPDLVDIIEYNGMIVGGGPMGVYQIDQFPFFVPEMAIIEKAMSENVPTFGVCLGAQLIAKMLGSRVEKTFWRRGFMYISPTEESVEDPLCSGITQPFPTFQFHQDEILDLPQDSILTLTSDNCRVEGFRLLNAPVWAIQAHPEVSLEKAMNILGSVDGLSTHEVSEMLKKGSFPHTESNSALFGNFFKLLKQD